METLFRGQRGQFWHSVLDNNGGVSFLFDFYIQEKDLQEFIRLLRNLDLMRGSDKKATVEFVRANFDVRRKLPEPIADIGGMGSDQEYCDGIWNDMFEQLISFKEQKGDCCVPRCCKENGVNLGGWVHNLCCNRRKGTLPLQQIQQLDNIGFVWNLHQDR
jgi:hypothetical protein